MANKIHIKDMILSSGETIQSITLSNGQITIVVHTYGARLHQLFVPDKNGAFENILLSKDNSNSYENDEGYYGVICGPVAGRIAGAAFDNVVLEKNEGENCLHSGSKRWERQIWSYKTFSNEDTVGITLMLKDTYSEFPGQIETSVSDVLADSTLKVKMTGLAYEDTIFNPAFHSYFNLSAERTNTLTHEISTNAECLVETDKENIPTGRLLKVDDTIYTLKESVLISKVLKKIPQGLDSCFVFPKDSNQNFLKLADTNSGRSMVCHTDRQSVVIYTATHPENSKVNGKPMTSNRGIAIEFQEIPDLVHHPEWGSIELKKGLKKEFETEYIFSNLSF